LHSCLQSVSFARMIDYEEFTVRFEATNQQLDELVSTVEGLKSHSDWAASHVSRGLLSEQLVVLINPGQSLDESLPECTITTAHQWYASRNAHVTQVDITRAADDPTGAPIWSAVSRDCGRCPSGIWAVKHLLFSGKNKGRMPGQETELNRWGASALLERLTQITSMR
jgi:hypothetical protein